MFVPCMVQLTERIAPLRVLTFRHTIRQTENVKLVARRLQPLLMFSPSATRMKRTRTRVVFIYSESGTA